MLAKAAELPADEIVIDLEDSVVPERKEEARAAAAAAARGGAFGERSVAVRINPLSSEWGSDDLAALGDAQVGSLVVPKVESADDLAAVDRLLADRPVGLQALIETARGLRDVFSIAQGSPRLDALIIGYADLAASLGRGPGADYPGDRWHWVRETVLVAARAAGLQAIDGPHVDIADLDSLRVEAGRARALGFDGKWALHPSQIEPLNEIFSPSAEEVEHAEAVLDALASASTGAALLDGVMVDEASRKVAAQVVARANAAGVRGEVSG